MELKRGYKLRKFEALGRVTAEISALGSLEQTATDIVSTLGNRKMP